MRERVERFTDIGRNGNEPPEVKEGVLMETEEENYHYHMDPVAFTEAASIAGGDFLPEDFNDYESKMIRGILSSDEVEVDEVYLGSSRGELDSRETRMVVNGEEISNIEPHTAFLYGINSDSDLYLDRGATDSLEEFKEKPLGTGAGKNKMLFDWYDIDAEERNWAELDEIDDEFQPIEFGTYSDKGSFDSFKLLENLSTSRGYRDFVGYEIDAEEGDDMFVSHKPIDNQPASYAFKAANMGRECDYSDFKKKDDTTLALYLIDRFDLDLDIAASFGRPDLGAQQEKIEERLNIRKPDSMNLYYDEGEGIPVSFVSRNLENWPYRDRASKFISYLTARDEIDEFDLEVSDEVSRDRLTEEMLKGSLGIEKLPEYDEGLEEYDVYSKEVSKSKDRIGFQ